MKGLILKDLLQLKNYKNTIFIFLVIVLILIIKENSVGSPILAVILSTFLFGNIGIASFSYDEQAKSDRYIKTFPLTKKDIVLSKYLLFTMTVVMGAVIGTVLGLLVSVIVTKQGLSFLETMLLMMISIFGVSLIEAIEIPCFYKFGLEKGRILFIAIIIFFVFGASVIIANVGDWLIGVVNFEEVINKVIYFVPLLLAIATFVVLWISYKISFRIFDGKEG